MKLVIYLFILIHFGCNECQWVQTNKTTFCEKVASCVSHSNNLTLPVGDVQSLLQNDGPRICEHATECGNSTDSHGNFIPENSNNMANSAKTRYLVNENETIFCSALNACKDRLNEFKYFQNMTHLCPYADHCGLNASMTVTDDETVSCCSSCSCSPDCGKNRECCFERQDNYKVVETEDMTCVDMELSFGVAGLYMFDKCPEDPECYKSGNFPEPVSSRITKRTYINMRCAKCITGFNESAFIRWQMALKSPGLNDETFKSCMNYRHSYCKAIYYLPSSHRAWIMHFVCDGRGFKTSCSPRKGIQNKKIAEACSSGIHAPVIDSRYSSYVYRNIFCALCTERDRNNHKPTAICQTSVQADGTPRGTSMSMLLDSEVFNAQKLDICLEKENNQGGGCRLLFCPDWMLRVNGKCAYYTRIWFDTYLAHQFVLTPSKPMAAAIFLNMTPEDRFRVHTWLFNDCNLPLEARREYLYRLYMLPTTLGDVSIVKEFYLRMSGRYANLTPKTFFPAIKACIDRRWRIVRDGMTYYLSASIYPYQRFMPDGKTKRPHVSMNWSYSETPLPRIYESISINENTFKSGSQEIYVIPLTATKYTVITKLAYCERVRLSLDEVDLMFGQIRIKKNSRVLNDGEFGAEYDTVDGETTLAFVYVCVEDFRYTGMTGSGRSIDQSAFGISYIMFVSGMTGVLKEHLLI